MATLTQQNLITEGKVRLHSITNVRIDVIKNEHAKMVICGVAQDDPELGDVTDQLFSRNIGSKFTLYRYENEKKAPVFSGLVETVQRINLRGLDYFEVEVISGTILFDQKRKKRSFQNVSMTYEAVVKQIVSEYNGGATICTVGEGTPIGTPLLQYDETDWQFIKRLASHFESVIYPEYTDSDPRVWFGFPNTMKAVEVPQTHYKYGQDELYYQLSYDYQPMDFRFVEIQSEQDFELGDRTDFKRKGYKLYQKCGNMIQGELCFTYRFGAAGLMHSPKYHNDIISGVSLLGTVVKDDKEDVYVKLDIDNGTGGTCPYPFRPETGNMMYCMPQVGTKVSLYFPNFDEKNAMAVNCFRTNGADCADMADTSKRAFSTEHGKSMTLHPTSMGLISQCGSHITLDDELGFDLKSIANFSIIGGGITFDAPKINLKSPKEINMMKVDTSFSTVYSSIVMCNQFDIIAKNGTRVTGTVFTYFEPFDDAPVEQGFNWGNLALGVLAGLAVVAVVGAVVFTGGAALVAAGAITATVASGAVTAAVVGGGASVAIITGIDLWRGKVSDIGDYLFAGASGAITGAVFGGVTALNAFAKLSKLGQLATMSTLGYGAGAGNNIAHQVIIQDVDEINWSQAHSMGVFGGVLSAVGYSAAPLLSKIPGMQWLGGKIQQLDDFFVGSINRTANRMVGGLPPSYQFNLVNQAGTLRAFMSKNELTRYNQSWDGIADDVLNDIGNSFKNHPLRVSYEDDVANLKYLADDLLGEGYAKEQVARMLHQARRDLGEIYKNATPRMLREYIYELNINRYNGDPLGGSFEYFYDKYTAKGLSPSEIYDKIIKAASRPNSNIDQFLKDFGVWINGK